MMLTLHGLENYGRLKMVWLLHCQNKKSTQIEGCLIQSIGHNFDSCILTQGLDKIIKSEFSSNLRIKFISTMELLLPGYYTRFSCSPKKCTF